MDEVEGAAERANAKGSQSADALRTKPVVVIAPPTPLAALSCSLTAAERWQSGRSRRTRNAEYAQAYRGFESLPLRQRNVKFNNYSHSSA